MNQLRPMLAATAALGDVRFPVYASPKLDGIRAVVVRGELLSRTLKRIPNVFTYSQYSLDYYEGLDGELIVGRPNSPLVFNETTSAIRRVDGRPEVTFHVFDNWAHRGPFKARLASLSSRDGIEVVPHNLLYTADQLYGAECAALEQGYEGLILRDPNGPYKYGRSTLNEGWMLKLKRFVDGEAIILDIEEEMENLNPAQRDERGYTKRTSHQDNKRGKGRMGALVVRDMKSGVTFNIGTGFTAADREAEWKIGELVKYKSFPVGEKDKPRHPVYLGRRALFDVPAIPGE